MTLNIPDQPQVFSSEFKTKDELIDKIKTVYEAESQLPKYYNASGLINFYEMKNIVVFSQEPLKPRQKDPNLVYYDIKELPFEKLKEIIDLEWRMRLS